MAVKSFSKWERIPSNDTSSRKLLLLTYATIPSLPIRSAAHRIALTYGSESAFLFVARDAFAYVSLTRRSMTLYLRFLLLSFSFSWPALYGGLPIITKIGASFCR